MSNTNPTPSWGQQGQPGGTGQWQQPGPEYYPPQPPKKRNGWKIGCLGCGGALAVVAVIGIVAAIASSGKSDNKATSSKNNNGTLTSSDNGAHPPQKDVTLVPGTCTVDEFGYPSVKIKVVNHSSQTSDYNIQVVFDDASKTRVADGAAVPTNVKPGETVLDHAGGIDAVKGKIICVLQKVDRNSSFTN